MKAWTDFDHSALFMVEAPTPPRSRLFCLPPAGAGSTLQESLISLLVRTSRAHAVNPRRLIGQIFGEVEPVINELAYAGFFSRLAGTINGLGQYAELFVSATERLTGQKNLRLLTLLPWKDLFPHNGQGLLARQPRWCPVCLFQQWRQGQETVFPLAWAMETFRVCPTHRRFLEDRCPYCGKLQPFIPRYPDLGVCDHCRQPLVSEASLDKSNHRGSHDQFELWVADALGDMLMRQSEPGFTPTIAGFRNFVRKQVAVLADGNRAAFCRAVGFHGHGLSGWLNKGQRPSITQFLTICYGVNVMPTCIFENPSQADAAGFRTPASKLKTRSPCPRPSPEQIKRLEVLVRAQLETDGCRPVSEIASELGFAARSMRYWFPELCRQLTAKYRTASKIRSESHQGNQCRWVEEIVRRLLNAGEYPSRRRVNALLRLDGMSLAQPHLLEAYIATMRNVTGANRSEPQSGA